LDIFPEGKAARNWRIRADPNPAAVAKSADCFRLLVHSMESKNTDCSSMVLERKGRQLSLPVYRRGSKWSDALPTLNPKSLVIKPLRCSNNSSVTNIRFLI